MGIKNIHLMSQYDKVLITDSDMRIAGSAYRTFLRKSSSSLIAGPVREGLDISLFHEQRNFYSNWYNTHMGNVALNWMGVGKDTAREKNATRWKLEQFSVVDAFEVGILDIFFALLNSQFAVWFFSQVLTNEYLNNQTSDWGISNIWCKAAKQYNPNFTSCALVTTSNLHGDTKAIGYKEEVTATKKGREAVTEFYMKEGLLGQEILKKDFKVWYIDVPTIPMWYCTIREEDIEGGGGEEAWINEKIQFNIASKDKCYNYLGDPIKN
jgi:hypothetical protein